MTIGSPRWNACGFQTGGALTSAARFGDAQGRKTASGCQVKPNPGAVPATWNQPSASGPAGRGLTVIHFMMGSAMSRATKRPSGPVVAVASDRLLSEVDCAMAMT